MCIGCQYLFIRSKETVTKEIYQEQLGNYFNSPHVFMLRRWHVKVTNIDRVPSPRLVHTESNPVIKLSPQKKHGKEGSHNLRYFTKEVWNLVSQCQVSHCHVCLTSLKLPVKVCLFFSACLVLTLPWS